ncbi:MAG: hypothetical protein Q9168_008379 [Polycauliona sp. 1 TL-2023]
MAGPPIYTRTYSASSAGQLAAAKTPRGGCLSQAAILEEFRLHSDKENRTPTAFVSASDRIVDSVKRAFDKHYRDGESQAEIWIAFIAIPSTINKTAPRVHSAKELAKKCHYAEYNSFHHEVVFEWAIPEKYVLHKISLETLIDRGLHKGHFRPLSDPEIYMSTKAIRSHIAIEMEKNNVWETGLNLGCFAQLFGARAPLEWIAHQLFYDCVKVVIKEVDIFLCDLDDAIDTSLYEWWLSDIDFLRRFEDHDEERAMIEDSMTWDWADFWEVWCNVTHDGTTEKRLVKEQVLFDLAKDQLSAKHE